MLHVQFNDRQVAETVQSRKELCCRHILVCRVQVAPFVCKKWSEALRQPSCAWESIHIDCGTVRKSEQVFPRLS